MKLTSEQRRELTNYKSDKPSRTQQQFVEETNVNSIIRKYQKTGIISHINSNTGNYGDFSSYGDFKTQLDTVRSAFAEFDAMPAHIRKKFSNDPAQLVEFLSDPQNLDEAVKLGLAQRNISIDPHLPQNDDLTTKQGKTKVDTQNAD